MAIKYAIVGCGGMSLGHLAGLAQLQKEGQELYELVAVCDIDTKRAEAFAVKAKEVLGNRDNMPEIFTSHQEMLKKSAVEAVGINTHHRSHHEIAFDVLEAKRHVIVEKPLALTPSLGREMIERAQKNKVTLAVAENYRRSPGSRALKAALEEGLLGRPYFIVQQFAGVGSAVFCRTPWRHLKAEGGAGPIFDNGVHDADLFLYWIGEVDEVASYHAVFEKYRQTEDIRVTPTAEDTDVTILKFANGVLGHWLCSWAGHGKGFSQTMIYGSKGSIASLPEGQPGKEITLDSGEKLSEQDLIKKYAPNVRTDTVASELEDFALAIRQGRKPETDGETGLKAMCISYAALESATIGKPVKVKDVLEGRTRVYEDSVLKLL